MLIFGIFCVVRITKTVSTWRHLILFSNLACESDRPRHREKLSIIH